MPASLYYITIAFLMLDPLYLILIWPLAGGGDMNGIKPLFPEEAVRVMFGKEILINE